MTDQGKNYSFDPVKVLAWVARYCRFSAKCDVYVYDDAHGSVTTHVKNGDVYFRQSPNLAADRLESLRADGYAIPQDAIDSLRERAAG